MSDGEGPGGELSRPPSNGGRTTKLVLICVVLYGLVAVVWAFTGSNDEPPMAQVSATQLADELAASAPLPADAVVHPGTPPPPLRTAFETAQLPHVVDVNREWIVPDSAAHVVAHFQHRVPDGLVMGECCGYWRDPPVTVQHVSYESRQFHAPVVSAQLSISVTRRTAHTTWVRVDGIVAWHAKNDPVNDPRLQK